MTGRPLTLQYENKYNINLGFDVNGLNTEVNWGRLSSSAGFENFCWGPGRSPSRGSGDELSQKLKHF